MNIIITGISVDEFVKIPVNIEATLITHNGDCHNDAEEVLKSKHYGHRSFRIINAKGVIQTEEFKVQVLPLNEDETQFYLETRDAKYYTNIDFTK